MKVLLLGEVSQTGHSVMQETLATMPRGSEIRLDRAMRGDPPEMLAEKFVDADMIVSPSFIKSFPPAPKLKLLHAPNAGLDSIEFDALPGGVRVCNVFEHDVGIGDYVMAAMLRFIVDLEGRSARFKSLDWTDTPRLGGPTRPELAGKTVLCIGYGSIGQGICQRAKAFGMQVVGITRSPREFDPAPDVIAPYDQMDELIKDADFVVAACPLTEETTGLVGADLISKMKPGCVIINVARGPVVDQHALYDALTNPDEEARLGGAVIDTWYNYPDPGDGAVEPADVPLWKLDNVVVTPHCSGWTDGLIERRFRIVAENAHALLTGAPLVNQVYPEG